MTFLNTLDDASIRWLRNFHRKMQAESTPGHPPTPRRWWSVPSKGGGEYTGPWQAVADEDIDIGGTGNISGDRLPDPSVSAFNAGFAVQSGTAVLASRIPASETDDSTAGELWVFENSPPTCYGLRRFFGVVGSPATDLIPLFEQAGGCATEAVEDCPAPPPGPTDPPFYVETQAELPPASNLYGGQIAYVTNDGEDSGQYMAIGAPQSLATEWMKI